MGYPSVAEDKQILARFRTEDPLDTLQPVITADELLEMQVAVRNVHLTGDVEDYIVRLIHATREHEALELGASPRAMLALYNAAQALAAVRGRDYATPDDIKHLATPILVHRLIPRAESRLRGRRAEQTLQEIMAKVFVPVEAEETTAEEPERAER